MNTLCEFSTPYEPQVDIVGRWISEHDSHIAYWTTWRLLTPVRLSVRNLGHNAKARTMDMLHEYLTSQKGQNL